MNDTSKNCGLEIHFDLTSSAKKKMKNKLLSCVQSFS